MFNLFIYKKKSIFFYNLSRMVKSGISINQALNELSNSVPRDVIFLLQQALESKRFEILQRNKKWFSEIEIQFFIIAAETGNWSLILDTLAKINEKKHEKITTLIAKLTYPFLLLNGMLFIPQLSILYLKGTSDYLKAIVPNFIILYVSLFIIFLLKDILFSLLINIPFFGKPFYDDIRANFFYLLGTSLKSGITITRAIAILENTTLNPWLKRKIELILQELQKGNQFYLAAEKANLFTNETLSIIKSAEISGSLDEAILHEAHLMEESAQKGINTLIKIFSFIIYLVVVISIARGIIGKISKSVEDVNKAINIDM